MSEGGWLSEDMVARANAMIEGLNAGLESSDETVGKAIRRMQKSIVEEYEKQERKENMKIEDCKTVNEFFGVEREGSIWIEGKMFTVYTTYITDDWSTIEQDGKALVGCLTGQLEWSTVEPSEDEFGSCDGCGYEFNSELISEYEIEYCPKCGRKIEEIIVPAMTAEEENILREIAAWFPQSDRDPRQSCSKRLFMTHGDIYLGGDVSTFMPFGDKTYNSKAYEVLAPILEKYGEINLDEYRGGETWFTNRDSCVFIEFPFVVPDKPEEIYLKKTPLVILWR